MRVAQKFPEAACPMSIAQGIEFHDWPDALQRRAKEKGSLLFLPILLRFLCLVTRWLHIPDLRGSHSPRNSTQWLEVVGKRPLLSCLTGKQSIADLNKTRPGLMRPFHTTWTTQVPHIPPTQHAEHAISLHLQNKCHL